MPRDLTALGGHESDASQIPISLVRLEIPSAEKRMHDLASTVALYLNPSTLAVSMAPGAGLLDFNAYGGLEVPELEAADDAPLAAVTLTVSNVTGEWYDIMAANAYRETAATIWQGNIVLAPGTSPFAATFQGVVTMFAGSLVHIQATPLTATIQLEPLDPFRHTLPHRFYSAPDFPNMAPPGTAYQWGGGMVEG